MNHILLRRCLVVALLTLLLVCCTPDRILTAHAQDTDFPVFTQGTDGVIAEQIQAWLDQWGYSLAIDGKYGPKTVQAVRSFQASHGLQVDGAVGDSTWGKLIIPLGRGSRGPAITALQKYLHAFFPRSSLAVDGVYGPQTEAAVQAFQHEVNQTADGIAGIHTWHALILTELD
jgi:peptidoglycan hydrolase-like protein with peptidoglycan-binding domain